MRLVDHELVKLVDNPRHDGAEPMWGEWVGHWRVRAGTWRVLYVIDDPRDVVVVKVGPRGSVYRRD